MNDEIGWRRASRLSDADVSSPILESRCRRRIFRSGHVDENIEYAQRLIQAGVPTELHVYPGAFHGFDLFAPSVRVSKQFKADRDNALRRALHAAS
jgi:acetyl esterase/lipase